MAIKRDQNLALKLRRWVRMTYNFMTLAQRVHTYVDQNDLVGYYGMIFPHCPHTTIFK